MLTIHDNVLSINELDSLNIDYSHGSELLTTADVLLNKLFGLASAYYNLDEVVVVEKWTHTEDSINTLKWHVDEDVVYRKETGISRLPICTMLYYPFVANDLMGGWFCTRTERIKPITNRAIIFDSSIPHTVEPSRGKRLSIIYNPWNHKIKQYGPIA